MPESIPISPEELFAIKASADAVAEANAFRTVPTNFYKIQGTKFSGYKNEPTPAHPEGRRIINCKAEVFQDSKRLLTIGFFISPDEGRTKSHKLDREFRLYNQLANALFPDMKGNVGSMVDAGALLERFTQYPVGAFITETFSSDPGPDGKRTYKDAKTDEEAIELRKLGWKPNNYVQSVGKVK